MADAASLNADCHSAPVDRVALDAALRVQGEEFSRHIAEHCPHLFAAVSLFVSSAQMEQMRAVIAAVEQVVALPGWQEALQGQVENASALTPLDSGARPSDALGVFMGYDFHLNRDGAHLIEINTNAGGAFLNALLLRSQRPMASPGASALPDDLEQIFLDMFRHEWQLMRGGAPLTSIAIVDEQPQQQYLYPEFVLAQRLFERAGLCAWILDPSELDVRGDGLYFGAEKIDLVYNRLTDFSLRQHAALSATYRDKLAVVTPHPQAYARYADKRNLARLTDADALRALGADEGTVAILQQGIPQTRLVHGAEHDMWWTERKHWFFKPVTGHGAKGAYRGHGISRRVFDEIMQGGYVAQRLAAPGERMVCLEGAEAAPFKADVRCFVYDGKMQLVAARLYQGQTTNFRTPGGGFAPVRVV